MRKNFKKILWAMKKAATKVVTPADRKKYVENKARKMDKNPTSLELAFIEMLRELKINFETQKIIKYKIFDFYIPEKNILIELDGNYWHGYGKTLAEMNHIQRKTFYNDKKKDALAKSQDFNLIRVFEHELDDEHYTETKEKMRKLLR